MSGVADPHAEDYMPQMLPNGVGGGLPFGQAAVDAVAIGGVLVSATAAEINKAADPDQMAINGLSRLGVARFEFDPSGDASMRTVAAHGLGVTLPDKAIVLGGFIQVITTFQSTAGGTDKATIAIHVQGANDIVSAVAIETGTPWAAGLQAIVPKFNTPETTGIALTDDREVTATVAVAALTAGKLVGFLFYVLGD